MRRERGAPARYDDAPLRRATRAGAVRRIADDRRLALARAASHAEGGEALPGVAALHLGQLGDEDPAAAGPDRMSERERPAESGGTPTNAARSLASPCGGTTSARECCLARAACWNESIGAVMSEHVVGSFSPETRSRRRRRGRRSCSRPRRTASRSAPACPSARARSARSQPRSATTGAILGAIDLVRVEHGTKLRDITVACIDGDARRAGRRGRPIGPRRDAVESVLDRTFLMHVGGKIEVNSDSPDQDTRRPLDGLHAGGGPRLRRRSPPSPSGRGR